MTADRLVGGKVRIQMAKFLPVLFADAMRDAPSTAVQLFESSSENPELIWTEDMRQRLSTVSHLYLTVCFILQQFEMNLGHVNRFSDA